jgi:hypothetical protein
MRKQWCHYHKTWTSDKWKSVRDMVRWVVLHVVPYIRRFAFGEPWKLTIWNPWLQQWNTGGGSVMIWTAISWYSIQLVPLLPSTADLLQTSMVTGSVIMCIPWSRSCIRGIQFSKKTMPPFTQMELISHITEPFWSVFETRGTDFHLQHLYSNLNMFLEKMV